ncbi:hypothetical protein PMO31116_02110 [Pandoraea morbifera]|uniref:Uncharacterized protein n=1 Tax=Pandoraea morbifera TaxID=2508300 RepID=A0A5E4UNE7_9BURK|nr:hypothetical protein PMO31116_02110 [Pandoraea morbifera]
MEARWGRDGAMMGPPWGHHGAAVAAARPNAIGAPVARVRGRPGDVTGIE